MGKENQIFNRGGREKEERKVVYEHKPQSFKREEFEYH